MEDLDLETRTFNCLVEQGLKNCIQEIGNRSIGDIVRVRNFGGKSLVDLLTSLESPASQHLGNSDARLQEALPEDMLVEARKLQRIRHARDIRRDDPRLGYLIRAIDPKARTVWDIAERLTAGIHMPIRANAQQLRALRKRIHSLYLARLETEFMGLANLIKGARNKEIVSRYMGWDGGGGATLQVVGEEFGLTRERVRQICSRVIELVFGKKPFTPCLDRTLKFIAAKAPAPAADIEVQLQLKGFTKSRFRLEGLLRTAQRLDREIPFEIVGSTRLVAASDSGRVLSAAISFAKRSIGSRGVTTVSDVAAQVADKLETEVAPDAIRNVLLIQEGFSWLDEATGWFWLSSVPRNRLLNQIRKIIAVAPRIRVSELRDGVGRHHRMEGFAPPKRVLLELCRQVPEYRVDDDAVVANHPLDWRKTLGDTEQTMVKVLNEHGPVMQRSKLEELCLAEGMKRSTFYIYLDYSPVIEKYARGVYGLRGAEVSPGLVGSLVPERRHDRVLEDYGWTQDGKIWVSYRLSESMIASGAFHVPAAMRNFLNGEFCLRVSDGSRFGSLILKEEGSWGLGNFFRRRGGEAGDYLLLVFDLAAHDGIVYIGDASVLEDFQATNRESANSTDVEAPTKSEVS